MRRGPRLTVLLLLLLLLLLQLLLLLLLLLLQLLLLLLLLVRLLLRLLLRLLHLYISLVLLRLLLLLLLRLVLLLGLLSLRWLLLCLGLHPRLPLRGRFVEPPRLVCGGRTQHRRADLAVTRYVKFRPRAFNRRTELPGGLWEARTMLLACACCGLVGASS
jgi:hypothetical protein